MVGALQRRWAAADTAARVTAAVTLVAILALPVQVLALHTLQDDPFISFRYAHNLATGLGPVFNPGQRVEGYTSPLWVFLLAGLAVLGLPIPATAWVLCFVCALLTVALLPRLTRTLGLRTYGLDALLLALNTSYAVWAGSSMELAPFGLLLVLAAWAFLGRRPPLSTGFLFALLTLLRPEGALFAGVALVFCAVDGLRGERRAWHRLLWLALGFSLPVVAHLTWRLLYYGYPLPNTFYAKVGLGLSQWLRGLQYVGEALVKYGLALTIPLVLAILQPRGRGWAFLLAGVGLYFFYVSLVGGDWMVAERLLVPVLPLAVALAAWGLVGVWIRIRRRVRPQSALTFAAVGLLAVSSGSFYPSFSVAPVLPWVNDARLISDWLNTHCPSGKKLAVFAAGALPYYAQDFEIVDMWGLNDATIAHLAEPQMGSGYAGHEKFDAKLVLAEKPDLFVFEPTLMDWPITQAAQWHVSGLAHLVRQFTDDAAFWSTHSTQSVQMPNGRYFNFVILNPYFCQ